MPQDIFKDKQQKYLLTMSPAQGKKEVKHLKNI